MDEAPTQPATYGRQLTSATESGRVGGVRPFLSARDAAFRLGEKLVFEHFNWCFHRAEHWAIVGGNGSGKSLLADALRGRLALARGELRYHFRSPAGLAPEEAIGHVSFEARKQDLRETVVQSRWNSLEEEAGLRVREFLSYERVMEINPFEVSRHHMAARRQFAVRLARAVRLLRLESFWDQTLLALSNGERQRVELGRALCHPLRLLILDEPFTGLDAGMRGHFREVLEHLMQGSVRVLLVTARLEELPRGLTHLLWVRDCQVVAAGRRGILLPACQQELDRANPTSKPFSPPVAGAEVREARAVPAGAGRRAQRQSGPGVGLVRLRQVTVRYGATTILSGINWDINAGENWALLGPNGSGKTTLLSLILGDNPQVYNNDVTVFGQRRGTGESLWSIRQGIGWMSPELQLHFDDGITCLEAVASGFFDTVGLFERPTLRQRNLARQWLDRFELLDWASAPLDALSAGLQRMVLLARALVKRPRLLILDEPCQGLDLAHRAVFLAAVEELLQAGSVTAIYVTHRLEEIPAAIHRVLHLEKGVGRPSLRGNPPPGDRTRGGAPG